MSKRKYQNISRAVYEQLVTFAEVSEKGNPMGRFMSKPVFVVQTMDQPEQGETYLCRLNHSCFGDFY